MIPLPADFLHRPIAHRGLHDIDRGIQENSPHAISRAISLGYAIELDLQLSADGQAVVFHDYDLERLALSTGFVRSFSAMELGNIRLRGEGECIPTLQQALDMVNGQAPLLIEIKDQDGALGKNTGVLEQEVARLLSTYSGPVAVMSFNPYSMAALRRAAPDLPLGLTSCDFMREEKWGFLPDARRAELSTLAGFDRFNAGFISHDHRDLSGKHVAELKLRGASILCWTIRSKSQEAKARNVAQNITFEGYLA